MTSGSTFAASVALSFCFTVFAASASATPCPETLECPAGTKLRRDANALVCEKHGKPHGPAVACHAGTLMERVFFREGLMHGVQELVDGAGRLRSTSQYVDGKAHGPSRSWYPGTEQLYTETMMAADERHGTSRMWHPNGQLASIYGFEHGLATGPGYEWHPNGRLRSILNYHAGKEHGEQRRFHENDAVSEIYRRRDGLLHGDYQGFTPEGVLRVHGRYADGLKVGEWVDHAVTGGTMAGTYVAGKQHGQWKVYDPAGVLVAVESFDHGQRHGPFEQHEAGRKMADNAYAQGLPTGVWTQYRKDGSVARRDTYDDGMKIEACEARKGGKLRCTTPVPYRLLDTGCELAVGEATHDIRDADQFGAVYTCAAPPPVIDWTQRRLWVSQARARSYTLSFGRIERTKKGLDVVLLQATICSGFAPPEVNYRFEVLLPRGDEAITSRLEHVPREPCGLRP